MSKKLLIYIISVVVILIFVITFFIIKKSQKFQGEPLRAIPSDAGIILKINDLNNFLNTIKDNKLWAELTNIESINYINKEIIFLDSMLVNNTPVKQLLLNSPSYVSVHPTGRNKTGVIHIFQIPDGLNERRINEVIKQLTGENGVISSRKYENCTIFDIRLTKDSSEKSYSYSNKRGLFILSASSILVEEVIMQMETSQSIADDRAFQKALKTSGKNVIANIFLNFNELPNLASGFITNNYYKKNENLSNLASWAELDLNVNENTLLLNGFTVLSDSIYQYLKLFEGQQPKRVTADEILPAEISGFLSFSVSDMNKYIENYKKMLIENGRFNKFQTKISGLKSSYNIDIYESFINLIDGEFVLASGEFKTQAEKSGDFAVFKIKSQGHTEKKLKEMVEKISEKESIPLSDLTTQIKIDNDLSYQVYKMPVDQFLPDLLGELFTNIKNSYFTFFNGYLIFGNSAESLGKLINSNILGNTLVAGPEYREFKDNLSPKFTICFYSDLSKAPVTYSEYFNESLLSDWEANLPVFRKVKLFGFQLNAGNTILYTTVLLKTATGNTDQPRTVWESHLDTAINFKPQFVINHLTNKQEIFLQDLNNSIYLINQAGRILWKQMLTEKINSAIYQVDFYKNGKLQILFSTQNFIHLIDRNGNYVERYPLKLRSPATNGMALFDYDNDKNYRIFIACEDKKIYVYTLEGILLPGWQFSGTDDIVLQPVNHFRINDKDYIVFGDRIRTYILDRRGDERVEVKDLIAPSKNNNFYLQDNNDENTASFVFTDSTGAICSIGLTGEIKKSNPGNFSANHFFDYKDVDGDGIKDFIFVDEDRLSVFRQYKNLIYTYSKDPGITLPPVYYQFSASDRKIGLVSTDKNLIYLINNDGTLYKGFPLQGRTLFSIGYFGNTEYRFNLIVGGNNNFLYNYIVQ